MRKIQALLFISIFCCSTSVSAQYISLVENKGEIGLMGGASFYRGDIASDILFYKPNIGVFYKKQLNDYVGLRLNYEYISIGANDLLIAAHALALDATLVSADADFLRVPGLQLENWLAVEV